MLTVQVPTKKGPDPCQPQFVLRQHTCSVTTVSFGPSRTRFQEWLVTGDVNGQLVLWDLILRDKIAAVHLPEGEPAPASTQKLRGILSAELHVLGGRAALLAQGRSRKLHVFTVVESNGDDDDDDDGASCSLILTHSVNVPQHGFCRFATYARSHSVLVVLPNDDVLLPMYLLSLTKKNNQSSSDGGEGGGEEMQLSAARSVRAAPEVVSRRFDQGGAAPQYGQLMSLSLVNCSAVLDGREANHQEDRGSDVDEVIAALTTWESGHVALIQLPNCDQSEEEQANKAPRLSDLRVVHRCFPEPAMCAALSGRINERHAQKSVGGGGDQCGEESNNSPLSHSLHILVTASAEGCIQGYHLHLPMCPAEEEKSRDEGATAPFAATVVFVWEQRISKGLECCVLSKAHGLLLLCGGWDGMIRLFDAEDGQVVTILTQHSKHAVSAVSSFDCRHSPTSIGGRGAPCFWLSSRASRGSEGGEKPDVFAAASKDGTVSIWAPLVVLNKSGPK